MQREIINSTSAKVTKQETASNWRQQEEISADWRQVIKILAYRRKINARGTVSSEVAAGHNSSPELL